MFVPQRQRLGRPPGSSRRTRPRRGAGQQRERNPVATDQWINLDLLVGNLQYVILTWQFDVVSLFFEKHVRLSIGRWRVISKHGDINQDIQWEIVNQCAETSGCPLQHKGKKHQETNRCWGLLGKLYIYICKARWRHAVIISHQSCIAVSSQLGLLSARSRWKHLPFPAPHTGLNHESCSCRFQRIVLQQSLLTFNMLQVSDQRH